MISIRGKLSGFNKLASSIRPAVPTLRDTLVTASRIHEKFSTTNLAYPLNVEGDPQQGHYISFFVRVTSPAKLKAYKQAKSIISAAAADEFGGGISREALLKARKAVESAKTSNGVKSNAIQIQNIPSVRLKTAISLYMPPSVQVSYETKYGEQEIGMLAETGYDAIKGFMSGESSKALTMKALEGGGQIVKQMALAAIETAAPGAKALFAIDRGKVITPKMELMFEGIGRRNFSFSFVFIPKSEQEAQVIKDIVYQFKYHMAANYVGGGAAGQREMKIPSMFDIEYMHIGKQNQNLNKISTCVLSKMDVEYGGDRYVAYEGGVPQTTKLSLSFSEMEIITKDHIEAGF